MPRVLVVDDDADIRTLVEHVLRLAGLDVTLSPSGVDALEALAHDDLPDLVLLDVQMPAQDGWTTLRRVRADARTAHLPVVLCTVKASLADAALGWTLGCDGYVSKPFAIAELVAEIEAVLARDEAARVERRAAALREIEEQERRVP